MKKRLFVLLGSTMVSVSIVLVLFAAVAPQPELSNGFSRKWTAVSILPDAVLDLGYNSFYFGGYQHDQIFLGNRTSPLFVVKCRGNLRDTTEHIISNLSPSVGSNCIFMEEDGTFFLCDRITRHVYSGNVNELRVTNTDSIKTGTDLIYPVSTGSYLLRSFGHNPVRYHLSKQENGLVRTDTTIIKNGENALFTSDGLLIANETRSQFIYSYFYRNQFLFLDSNLKVLNTVRTIDTNFTAKLHLTSIKDGQAITISGKPKVINTTTCLHDSLLYIYSKLKADNQSDSSYRASNNIDVYNIFTGAYVGSVALPRYKKAQISSLQIYESKLYVIAGRYLLRYPIQQMKWEHS